MKWYSIYKYRPQYEARIWLWGKSNNKPRLSTALWDEINWEPDKIWLHTIYEPMWAYVFEDDYRPIDIRPIYLEDINK